MDMDKAFDDARQRYEQGQCILLPLDGSRSVERALHAAEMMARACGARLILLRTVAPLAWDEHIRPGALSPLVFQQVREDEEYDAHGYLEHLARPLRQRGVDVRTRVACGDATAHLLTAVEQLHPMLVVLAEAVETGRPRTAAHTGGEAGRMADELGEIATQIVSQGGVPVLVVPPTEHHVQAGAGVGVGERGQRAE